MSSSAAGRCSKYRAAQAGGSGSRGNRCLRLDPQPDAKTEARTLTQLLRIELIKLQGVPHSAIEAIQPSYDLPARFSKGLDAVCIRCRDRSVISLEAFEWEPLGEAPQRSA